jgi:hypothetical protein
LAVGAPNPAGFEPVKGRFIFKGADRTYTPGDPQKNGRASFKLTVLTWDFCLSQGQQVARILQSVSDYWPYGF